MYVCSRCGWQLITKGVGVNYVMGFLLLAIGLIGLTVAWPAYKTSQSCGDALLAALEVQQKGGTIVERHAADAAADAICLKAGKQAQILDKALSAQQH